VKNPLAGERVLGVGEAARATRAARRAWRAGTTASATTSVRLCVAPPARKKRRRTRPTATTSVSGARAWAAAGAPNQTTGTDSAARPSVPGTVMS
jgi:hypothetical protein